MRRTTGSYLNQRYYFVKGQAWTGRDAVSKVNYHQHLSP
nr:MAG TPA: hypothetical protein [Caudoviricetes sp.]